MPPIVLHRPLLSPPSETMAGLRTTMRRTARRHLRETFNDDSVRFSSPKSIAVRIIGANAIEGAVREARPGSELTQLSAGGLALQLYALLPASAENSISTQAQSHQFVSRQGRQRHLVTNLQPSAILEERIAAVKVLRQLGGHVAGEPPIALEPQPITLGKFFVDTTPSLENDIIAIANNLLPSGTELTFGPVVPFHLSGPLRFR
ncbi:MAG TPA: hypothetical protein VJ836_03140 [Candidatus Saccharimonadales bacterium]|nr:hypothetical protein [Candidatus Saccharimonadales bacterium]